MLGSSAYMMMKSTRAHVNIWEWVILRGGLSLYSGWLTAATILVVTTILQDLGMVDPNILVGNEQQWTVAVLWIALVIYNVAQYSEKNPIFGAVFVWALLAITTEQADYELITFNTILIACI